jgi:glucose-1-phosphate cytidylyltransferase
MKVVLFCGGYGMRMRDGTSDQPKPMVPVGPRPLLWHVMRYYAHYGHKDFILCLGYGGHHIKQFFLDYQEAASNDFVLQGGQVELLSSDIADWSITFVDTGLESPIGERLRRVRHLLAGEEMFLANYADVLTDAPIDEMVAQFTDTPDAVAQLLAVPPQAAFHVVDVGEDDDRIQAITALKDMRLQENGGYLVLRQEIFDHLPENADLIADVCAVLAEQGRVTAYPYSGFWHPADTVKERVALEALYRAGRTPWMPWRSDVPPVAQPVGSPAAPSAAPSAAAPELGVPAHWG